MDLKLSLHPEVWDRALYPDRPCYSYQMAAWLAMEQAVSDALFGQLLIELLFKWARQAGKNEVDSRFTAWLMVAYSLLIDHLPQRLPVLEAIKTAPTYRPGISVSRRRLELALDQLAAHLDLPGKRPWDSREGYVYWLKAFRRVHYKFLSAQERANKRGETANLFMSVDESQSTSLTVYSAELAAMRSTTAAAIAFWGTGGVEGSLIEAKQDELQALQEADGRQRVFVVDWQQVAEHNEAYGRFVERERDRMGENHVIFLSEYRMQRIAQFGDFLDQVDYDRMWGKRPRLYKPVASGRLRVGGVDFCGAGEMPDEAALDPSYSEERDSTCALVGELVWAKYRNELGEEEVLMVVLVVAMLLRPGKLPESLVDELDQFLFQTWRCQLVVVDARGVGDGPSKTLEHRRGKKQVIRLESTLPDVSRMGYRLQGLLKSRRLQWFGSDGVDPELEECRKQFKYLRREVLPTKQMRWGHPKRRVLVPYRSPSGIIVAARPESIHDDIPKAAGYLVEAAYRCAAVARPKAAKREFEPWEEAAGIAG